MYQIVLFGVEGTCVLYVNVQWPGDGTNDLSTVLPNVPPQPTTPSSTICYNTIS